VGRWALRLRSSWTRQGYHTVPVPPTRTCAPKGGNCGLGSRDASFLEGYLRTNRRSSRQACRDSAWALDPGRSFGSVNLQLPEFFRLAERLSAIQHVLTTTPDQVVLARLRLPAERRSAALQFGIRPSQRGQLRTNSARCTWPLIPCSPLPDGRTKQRGPSAFHCIGHGPETRWRLAGLISCSLPGG
jgi:hypothetical protein